MSQNHIKFYAIDSEGVEQQIDLQKLRIQFQDETNITLEIDNRNESTPPEIVLRGYHGNEECSNTEPEKFVIFNIRPKACNVISVHAESRNRKSKI